MHEPTLSVTMPNYNHERYLKDAFKSILGQPYKPMEFIVLDDASTDNSVDVIEQFVRRDPTVRLMRNERNMGVMYNIMKLIEISRGDYTYGISADDKVLPGFFEKSMALLKQYPQAGVCCTDTIYIDDKDNVIGEDRLYLSDKPRYFSPDEVVEILRKKMLGITGTSFIFKRSSLIEAGNFIPELRWYCDTFAIFVVAFRHGLCYVPEPLAVKRIEPRQFSSNPLINKQLNYDVDTHMLNLLNSPSYSDVRHRFKRSLVLSYFYSPMLRVIFINPKFWYYFSFKLFLRTFWRTMKKKLNPYIPFRLKNIYYIIRNRHSKSIFRG